MKEKLIGKKIRVAVAFITASKMTLVNITKYYDGVVIDIEDNFKVFQFDFDTEKLNYKFDLEIKPMGGIQKVTDIVFIGFCD